MVGFCGSRRDGFFSRAIINISRSLIESGVDCSWFCDSRCYEPRVNNRLREAANRNFWQWLKSLDLLVITPDTDVSVSKLASSLRFPSVLFAPTDRMRDKVIAHSQYTDLVISPTPFSNPESLGVPDHSILRLDWAHEFALDKEFSLWESDKINVLLPLFPWACGRVDARVVDYIPSFYECPFVDLTVIADPRAWGPSWYRKWCQLELDGMFLSSRAIDNDLFLSMLGNFDLVIWPGHSTGLYFPIVEAMAYGVPVLTCDSIPHRSLLGSYIDRLVPTHVDGSADLELFDIAFRELAADWSAVESMQKAVRASAKTRTVKFNRQVRKYATQLCSIK